MTPQVLACFEQCRFFFHALGDTFLFRGTVACVARDEMSSRTVLKPCPNMRTWWAFGVPFSRNIHGSVADIRNFVVHDELLSHSVATMLGCYGKRNIIGRNERLFLAKTH